MSATLTQGPRPVPDRSASEEAREAGRHHRAGAGVPLFLRSPAPSAPGGQTGAAVDHREAAAGGTGKALQPRIRAALEQGFGHDLGRVRVHDDARASGAAADLHAAAYTVGEDIVFGAGRFRPDTPRGARLLAHEVAHVVQQRAGRTVGASGVSDPADPLEHDADRMAEDALNGRRPGLQVATGPAPSGGAVAVQRQDEDDERSWDFEAIPPRLSGPVGPLDFSADTSRAQLGYRSGDANATLGYEYGGNIFLRGGGAGYGAGLTFDPGTLAFGLSGSHGGTSGRFGYNPEAGAFSFGGSHAGFRLGGSATTAGAFGVNLGYGAPLFPFPSALGERVNAGAAGLHGVMGAVPGFMNDPLGTYAAQSGNIDAITGAYNALSPLASDAYRGGLPFGAGLNIGWDPELRDFRVMGGVQGHF